jgi:hypothetical protein
MRGGRGNGLLQMFILVKFNDRDWLSLNTVARRLSRVTYLQDSPPRGFLLILRTLFSREVVVKKVVF